MFIIHMALQPGFPRIEMRTGLAKGAIAFVESDDRSEAVRLTEEALEELGLESLEVAHSGVVGNEGLPGDSPEQLREAYHDALRAGFGIAIFTE